MKISKIALFISMFYLLLVVLSFVILLMTANNTPMAGIFLVTLTPPWPIILGKVQDRFGDISANLNGLFLLAGGILNGILLYFFISQVVARLKKSRP